MQPQEKASPDPLAGYLSQISLYADQIAFPSIAVGLSKEMLPKHSDVIQGIVQHISKEMERKKVKKHIAVKLSRVLHNESIDSDVIGTKKRK